MADNKRFALVEELVGSNKTAANMGSSWAKSSFLRTGREPTLTLYMISGTKSAFLGSCIAARLKPTHNISVNENICRLFFIPQRSPN